MMRTVFPLDFPFLDVTVNQVSVKYLQAPVQETKAGMQMQDQQIFLLLMPYPAISTGQALLNGFKTTNLCSLNALLRQTLVIGDTNKLLSTVYIGLIQLKQKKTNNLISQ